jgi:hypothetical protein
MKSKNKQQENLKHCVENKSTLMDVRGRENALPFSRQVGEPVGDEKLFLEQICFAEN